MSYFRSSQVVLLAALAIVPAFGSRTHRAPTSGHSRKVSSTRAKRKEASHLHGQRAIDATRAVEIQNALVQKKYLSEASGQWDAQTQVAMRQYQSDHGWQTKLTPDSRALISLGLGPSHVEAPAIRTTAATVGATPLAAESASQAQSAEPAANTLASVHSLSQ